MVPEIFKLLVLGAIYKNATKWDGSSRHLDFIAACQYSSKQSLLKPGTNLDYVTDIILSKLFYIIPQVCTSHNIKKVLINIISKDTALFLPLKCELHDLGSFVLEQLIVCIIYFWIKQVNLLLSGKNRKFVELVNSNDTANLDPIKLLAHKYYGLIRTAPLVICTRYKMVPEIFKLLVLGAIYKNATKWDGSSRHLDFIAACQYSSKQSLLKPGTNLDYVTDIILSKLFYIIPQVCTSHNIKKVLINIISKDTALFLPLKCELHDLGSFVLEQLIVCIIYFWIKQVNLLLSGKNRKFVELVNSNDTANLDPIKLLAHKYYGLIRTAPLVICTRYKMVPEIFKLLVLGAIYKNATKWETGHNTVLDKKAKDAAAFILFMDPVI
ncbi:hypothetical protein FQA39_LY05926 [Lamprigera yunnana]|nr:hypothetical protein FQA39_LY05926 [Lamprigera yunnana]